MGRGMAIENAFNQRRDGKSGYRLAGVHVFSRIVIAGQNDKRSGFAVGQIESHLRDLVGEHTAEIAPARLQIAQWTYLFQDLLDFGLKQNHQQDEQYLPQDLKNQGD